MKYQPLITAACLPRCHSLVLGLLFLAAAAFSAHSPAQTTRQSSASESAPSTSIARGKRVALVVGNANYAYIGKLGDNPRNDADDIEQALRRFGFSVTKLKDASKRDMTAALEEFGRQASGSEAALFYFAGHGMQIRGENYLMPVNASADSEAAVKDEAVSVNRVLDELDGSARIKIVLLDACRDNPINGKFRSSARGLAATTAPPGGTVIAYAAEPGKVAANGGGRNGIFTQGLLQGLNGKDLSLDGVLTVASEEVESQSQQKQVPYVNGPKTLQKRFNFNLTVNPGPAMQEAQFWDSIKTSTDVADYEAYLKQHPNGGFRPLADNAIKRLRAQKPALVVPSAVVPIPVAPLPQPAPVVAAQAPVVQAPQAGSTFKDCADCPEMVVIPAGSFTMGSSAAEQALANEAGAAKDLTDRENPQHTVRVASFSLGKTEVTVAQFRRFVEAKNYQTDAERNLNATGCFAWLNSDGKFDWRADHSWRNPGWTVKDNEPVTCISHNDATAYVQWLSQSTRKTYQLPSEAQWEYAARAGSSTSRPWGDNSNDACKHANGTDQTKGPTGQSWSKIHECNDGYWFVAPVGNYQANAFGLHDMLGNVWEWTQDCWNASYQGAPTNDSAWTTGDCTQRVLRGGSWNIDPAYLRSAYRNRSTTDYRSPASGFRLARTLP